MKSASGLPTSTVRKSTLHLPTSKRSRTEKNRSRHCGCQLSLFRSRHPMCRLPPENKLTLTHLKSALRVLTFTISKSASRVLTSKHTSFFIYVKSALPVPTSLFIVSTTKVAGIGKRRRRDLIQGGMTAGSFGRTARRRRPSWPSLVNTTRPKVTSCNPAVQSGGSPLAAAQAAAIGDAGGEGQCEPL